MAAMFVELLRHSLVALQQSGPDFLISQKWNPVTQEFGAASSIFGTLVSTLIATFLAVPLSLAIALFLVELAPPALAGWWAPLLSCWPPFPASSMGCRAFLCLRRLWRTTCSRF